MSVTPTTPTITGRAFRVTILRQEAEVYEHVYVQLDAQHPVAHVFSANGQTHYLTIPLTAALIVWQDPAALHPVPRLPAFGPSAFDRLGQHAQRMAEGIGRAFEPGVPPQNWVGSGAAA